MEFHESPRRTGDIVSLLAAEPLDSYSHHELDERIALLKAEIVRVASHRDKAAAHRLAADALFGSPPIASIPPEGSSPSKGGGS